ncbi:hypothetical protein KFL_002020120 [Klebsormidium nitens]|uniref:Lon N-terminal domain-containing protein n=1 Tax=Klebsormidium nitens TaxID=105231 RepID=A0A1Y1I7P9_KLENI|nr:hypothetical protein KFL_002020120 [Klebsormidium nitens]|eukprot:GAQ84716.1 hypothetical protein KFL_002020120 [Klebsormidium nitens]
MALSQKLVQHYISSLKPYGLNHRVSALSALCLLLRDSQPLSRFQHSAPTQADPDSFQKPALEQTPPGERLEVTQSWTAEHRTVDGSLHKFATVIIEQGHLPGAAALAWHHARKLLLGVPNVGVAYVSKPTGAAWGAVAELANRMGGANPGGNSEQTGGKPSPHEAVGVKSTEFGGALTGAIRRDGGVGGGRRDEGKVLRSGEVLRADRRRSGGPILFDDKTWQWHVRAGSERKGFGRAERSQKAVIYHATEYPRGGVRSRSSNSVLHAEGRGGGKSGEEATGGVLPLVGCTASSWAYDGDDDGRGGGAGQKKAETTSGENKTAATFGGMASAPQSYIELPSLVPGVVSRGKPGGGPWMRLIYPREQQDVVFDHWDKIGFESAISHTEAEEDSEGPDVRVQISIAEHGDGEDSCVGMGDDESSFDDYYEDESSGNEFGQSERDVDELADAMHVRAQMWQFDSDSSDDESDQSGSESGEEERVGYEEGEYPTLKLPLPAYEDGHGFKGIMDGKTVLLEKGLAEGVAYKLQFFEVLQNFLAWRQKSDPASIDHFADEWQCLIDHLQTEVQELHSLQMEACENRDTAERRVFFRFAYTDPEGIPSDGIFFLTDELLPPDTDYDVSDTPRVIPLDPGDTLIRHVLESFRPDGDFPEANHLAPGYRFIKRPTMEGKSRSSGAGESAGAGPGEAVDDPPFRLTFVAGAMPGVKVEAFHSTRAALPNLENLEQMLLRSQPHFLLFGQPGFDHSAFRERLTSLFPEGAKAGVFSTPTSVLSAAGGSVMNDGPLQSQLYYGDQRASKGVCGLALYSEGDGVIPVDAFAAFLKDAIGAPRFAGTCVFDDVISRELFRPAKPDASRAERRRTLHRSDEKLESLESLFRWWRSKLKGPINARAAPNSTRRASTSAPNRASEEKTLWRSPENPEEILDALQVTNKYIELRKASLERRFGRLVSERGGMEGREGTPWKRDPRLAPGMVAKLPLFLVYPPPCPGETIERFIFEPRYRLLARHCVEEGSPLGVCSLDPDPATGQIVGTAASIDVIEYDEAFRSNVELHGLQRFRLKTPRIWVPPSSFGLYVAEVEFFDDEPCTSDREREELIGLARRSIALFRRSYPNEWRRDKVLSADVTDPVAVSFALAEALPTRNYTKQRWLAGTCTRQRLQEQMHNMKERSTQTSSRAESYDMDG